MGTPSNIFTQFNSGKVTVNEFAVYVAVNTKAFNGVVNDVTTTEIASDLRNGLSRHAVARALRSLQRKNMLNWQTALGRTGSTITVR